MNGLIRDQVHTHLLLCQLGFLQGLEIWTVFQALGSIARRTILGHPTFLPSNRSYGPVPRLQPGEFILQIVDLMQIPASSYDTLYQINKVWTSKDHASNIAHIIQTHQNMCASCETHLPTFPARLSGRSDKVFLVAGHTHDEFHQGTKFDASGRIPHKKH